ncbi:MAG: DUF72 domain-containing protein [Gemmataceae bacterium]|nr:DUF72 domain-containing protein [Gemmataceae bacterium]
MHVWIGTGGYGYNEWHGAFYPPGLPPGKMLAHYARRFPVVELNFSFYGSPTFDRFARQAGQTPDGFRFTVKVPQSISHEQSDRELHAFRDAVAGLGDKLSSLVLQFPQSFHHDRAHRRWLEHVTGELAPYPVGVEFRHWTWARPDVPEWLECHGAFQIAVDVPDLPALFPRGLVRSGHTLYVRFHTRSANAWHTADRERLEYDYPEETLAAWAEQIAHEAPAVNDAYLIFNNCRGPHAITNAQRMHDLLAGRLGVHVVDPFAAPLPTQLSLF